jgi:hypothetical protein
VPFRGCERRDDGDRQSGCGEQRRSPALPSTSPMADQVGDVGRKQTSGCRPLQEVGDVSWAKSSATGRLPT